jgi:Tfp pilus assembly protein PilO
MRNLTLREKILIALAAVVALVIGLPSLLSSGTLQVTGNSEQKRAAIIQRQKKAEKAIEYAQAVIAEQEPKVRELGWEQSADELVPILVQNLERIAETSGVALTSYRPLKPKSLETLTEVPLEMSLTAPFPAVVKFLYYLQQPSMKVSIDTVRISSANAESDTVDVNIRITAYSLKTKGTSTTRPVLATSARS